MNANLQPGWVQTLTAAGMTTRPSDDQTAAAYQAQYATFGGPRPVHGPRPFASIDAANRFVARVALIEGLGDAYVMPCPELTIQAVAIDVSGRTVVCLPAVRNALWSRVTLLHELAHVAAPSWPAHGPRWAGVFVRMVREHLSLTAGDRLDWEFHRVGIVPQVSAGNVAVVGVAG